MTSRAAMDRLVDDHFMYEATADLEGVMRTYSDAPVQANERLWFDLDEMRKQLR